MQLSIMRVLNIGNAVEVFDIDLMDDEACLELGYVVAKENVVLLRQAVSEQRLYDIHMPVSYTHLTLPTILLV